MQERFYRPELDVIRFLAFLTVFVHHSIPARSPDGVGGALTAAASFGLCLFFTLSAYLITTLLLKERGKTGTIDLPRFYKRRALRIWPLYFLALTGSIAVGALHHHLGKEMLWFGAAFVMLGNVVQSQVTSVIHLWSISVEEQFYVFWPTLMKRLSVRALGVAALVVIAISNGVLVWYGLIHADTWQRIWWNTFVQMEMFAAGILLALYTHRAGAKKHVLPVRVLLLAAVPCAWFAAAYVFRIKGIDVAARGPLSLCVGYGLVAASCAALIFALQGTERWPKAAIYFGKISYGLYVFHLLGMAVVQHLLPHVPLALQMLGGLALTMGIASLSYRFFETPFLRLKERFEVVKSRPVS